MVEHHHIAIIGAGPAGMSAAAHAAELGIDHILLDSAPHIANTIHRYQSRKRVMDEPARLPLRSTLRFATGLREQILENWQHDLTAQQVQVRTGTTVTGIRGQRGDFQIRLSTGAMLTAAHVVLAIGIQGNIRRLTIPGAELPEVQYELEEPDAFQHQTIVVIGDGDAGVENALALAHQNRVILLNRKEEFSNCTLANLDLLMEAVTAQKVETRISTTTQRIVALSQDPFPVALEVVTPQGHEQIKCHRIIVRIGATPPRQLVESFGVRFPNADPVAVPQLSDTYESNVPGLYIIGALAGYPLIKQAMNQGYEVIEYILGNTIEPADEGLLWEKFSGIPGVESVRAGIALLQNHQPLLTDLTTLQLREFMLDSTIQVHPPGEVVFEQNDYSNSFFSILQGRVSINITKEDGTKAVFTLSQGHFFGEMGLLSGRRRTATVITEEQCVLVETPRRSMLKLLSVVESVQRKLDEVSLRRIVQQLDSSLAPNELEYLVQDAQFKPFAIGEVIFREGDTADGLYLIRRGSVSVSRQVSGKEVVLAYLSAGNYFGEMALVSDAPRSATITAAAPTEVILLTAERFKAVIARNASMRNKVETRYLDHVGNTESMTSSESSGWMNFLFDQGVGNATNLLLINYALCIRCDNCAVACANVHDGISRLHRESGMTYEQMHLPTSCRHCEHPYCMKNCPPDAIHRSINGEVFISDRCIHCGNCQRHCPYGVIQAATRKPFRPPGIWQILSGGQEKTVDPPTQEENTEESKMYVKCDMCKEILGGAACIRACPTGAAMRVTPERYFEDLTSWATESMSAMQARSFLHYKNFRYLLFSGLLVALATTAYLTVDPGGSGHHGGTWLGYVLGSISMLLLLLHIGYGLRKRLAPRVPNRRSMRTVNMAATPPLRTQERRRARTKESWRFGGTLQGWLSAHVYLGIALLILASLHAGFHVGWNVHTLVYVMLWLVALSGGYGTFVYLYYPKRITKNLNNSTLDGVLKEIQQLDATIRQRALDLPDAVHAVIAQSRLKTRIGGNLWQQISGIQKHCPTAAAVDHLKQAGLDPALEDRKKQVRELYYLCLKKKMLVARARRDVAMRARMQFWLYLHTPLSIALLAALFVHIWAIYFYW
ncbi:MAG: cyclic nucleotide-binding domain-containing protein [Magnetococcales bacterium]|nr:cyclic nucleotide-binding domain-containing protein [Magnetococcales bacterium]NGZ05075.1 cyclic nucleotide-binding domain-containing protein [Magnetococcales bacterium]